MSTIIGGFGKGVDGSVSINLSSCGASKEPGKSAKKERPQRDEKQSFVPQLSLRSNSVWARGITRWRNADRARPARLGQSTFVIQNTNEGVW